MSTLHISQIRKQLLKDYRKCIDMGDWAGKPATKEQQAFLSRALAAFTIRQLADVKEKVAGQAVVDAFDDNGIDAAYYDSELRTLWLVQSKWVESGKKCPDGGDVRKFRDGINDLVEENYGKFGASLRSKQQDIEEALNDPNIQIKLVLSYTGPKLAPASAQPLLELVKDLNDPSEIAELICFDLAEIHACLRRGVEEKPASFDFSLTEWGQVRDPYQAFYGQAAIPDVAALAKQFGHRLFARNIRRFLGDTSINDDIRGTLLTKPEEFLYFNNGITILCDGIRKLPSGGSSHATGIFHCEGGRVVNGAQTVGVIGSTYTGQPAMDTARVFVRIVSLEQCPPNYWSEITRATNTQNRLEKRDFVSLDPRQEELKQDLALEKVAYVYKSGDEVKGRKCITLQDLTVALACASGNLLLAILAKKEVGKLWEDDSKAPYTTLFSSSLTPMMARRVVDTMRTVDHTLSGIMSDSKCDPVERNVARHANRVIAHLVFAKSGVSGGTTSVLTRNELKLIRRLTKLLHKALCSEVRAQYPSAYLSRLFYNTTKTAALVSAVKDLALPREECLRE
jgi:hypothetical protein